MRVRTTTAFVLMIAAGALIWNVAAAQQTQSRPTLGSGVIPVEGNVNVSGTVNIGNVPTVGALQLGDWKAAVTSLPPVSLSGPDFVQVGGRYVITWASGDSETLTVATIGRGGWFRVGDKPERWVNLSSARSVAVAN